MATGGWSLSVHTQRLNETPGNCLQLFFDGKERRQRCNGCDTSSSTMAKELCIGVLEPASHGLISDGPQQRRRFLDWGLFHVEPRFLDQWRRYRKALKQRNAALKSGCHGAALRAWTRELAESGEILDEFSREQFKNVAGQTEEMLDRLVGEGPWELRFERGWDAQKSLISVLTAHEDGDRRVGMTRYGPHRRDIRIRRKSRAARTVLSRGEAKLAAASLLIVQAREISRSVGEEPVLMVDDFASELGCAAQKRLLDCLLGTSAQVVVTAHSHETGVIELATPVKFHVEHGQFTRVLD